MHELAALHQDLFRGGGWSRGEAMQSAATVIGRLRDGRGELYKMKTAKFVREYVQATPQEMATFGHLLTPVGDTHNFLRSTWQHGVMGFEPMRGLTVERHIKETKRRQSEAGRYSAQNRSTTHAVEVREQARQLRSQGMSTTRIAEHLTTTLQRKISQSTVSRWLQGKL